MDKKTPLAIIDPLLHCPDQNIEHNMADGIDDMMPDPDDVPSGFTVNGKIRPDLMESDAQSIVEKDLLQMKILSLRK